MRNYQVKLHNDKTVKPVAQAHRRILFHVRKQVESKLKEMENDDIVERVEGTTPWVSPIVVFPKPHNPEEIRICVYMRQPNKAIGRESIYLQPLMTLFQKWVKQKFLKTRPKSGLPPVTTITRIPIYYNI